MTKTRFVLQAAEEEAATVRIVIDGVVHGQEEENANEIRDTWTTSAKRAVGDAEKQSTMPPYSSSMPPHYYSDGDIFILFLLYTRCLRGTAAVTMRELMTT